MIVISLLLTLFTITLLVRAVLSWFPQPSGTLASVNHAAVTITEPVVGPVRRVLPSTGGFDFSILVVFLGIYVLRILLGI